MASLNKAMLIGNLTAAVELRRTPSGVAVASLRMAVNESFQNKAGEKVDKTIFLDVDVWDRQAETCQQYLSKGSPVFIEGALQMDQWDDKETGQKRSKIKVRADRVQFLGKRGEDSQGERQEPSAPRNAAPAAQADEEIPF